MSIVLLLRSRAEKRCELSAPLQPDSAHQLVFRLVMRTKLLIQAAAAMAEESALAHMKKLNLVGKLARTRAKKQHHQSSTHNSFNQRSGRRSNPLNQKRSTTWATCISVGRVWSKISRQPGNGSRKQRHKDMQMRSMP